MKIEKHQLVDFKNGWFVGQFEPTLINSEGVEVAIQHFSAGEYVAPHHHKIAVELTAIIEGHARMSGLDLGPGDIVRIEPGESTDFIPLTDVTTVVVKAPSVAGDKYLD